MADPKLSTPTIDVIRASDPTPLRVQAIHPDLVLWDRTRIKHKWPKFDDVPWEWLGFLSWAAARRTGIIDPAVTYETWTADLLQVTAVDDDDDDPAGRPTQQDPGAG